MPTQYPPPPTSHPLYPPPYTPPHIPPTYTPPYPPPPPPDKGYSVDVSHIETLLNALDDASHVAGAFELRALISQVLFFLFFSLAGLFCPYATPHSS